MADHYILDESGQPVATDLMTWARRARDSNRHIGKTTIGEVKISTVFLGLNHQFGEGPPLLFETMIFGGAHDQFMERYSTRDEAVKGHEKAVAMVAGEPA